MSSECCGSQCTTSLENETLHSTHDYIGKLEPEQQGRCEQVRALCRELETVLLQSPVSGGRSFSDRCLSLARTKLEEACMFAIKSIAFEGKRVR